MKLHKHYGHLSYIELSSQMISNMFPKIIDLTFA